MSQNFRQFEVAEPKIISKKPDGGGGGGIMFPQGE